MTQSPTGPNLRPQGTETLLAAAKTASENGKMPPVHLWNPEFCGDLDMRIARDGTWFYLGSPIGREPLVRLFSSILKREGDKYYLVTPVEKVGIIVDDTPLHAVDFDVSGLGEDQELTFTMKTGETVIAGGEHPLKIEFDPISAEPSPSILVRAGLWARIDRKSFFRLAELGCHSNQDGASWFGLWSGGQFFPVIPSTQLV